MLPTRNVHACVLLYQRDVMSWADFGGKNEKDGERSLEGKRACLFYDAAGNRWSRDVPGSFLSPRVDGGSVEVKRLD